MRQGFLRIAALATCMAFLAAGAAFAPLPSAAAKAKNYDAWKKSFVDALGSEASDRSALVAAIACGVALMIHLNQFDAQILAQNLISGADSFPLLAVPFFILAGNLMNITGITERLLTFARLLTGWMIGGLAQVSIVLSALMGGISGNVVPAANIQQLPFAFRSADNAHKAMDGALGAYLRQEMAANGIVGFPVGAFDNGMRQIGGRTRPIRVPADFTGLKLRVPGLSPTENVLFIVDKTIPQISLAVLLMG